LETDVCIVGAGAAGIVLADALSTAGREVCLIESGDQRPDETTQSLYDLESVGYPPRANYMSRARYFGGSCNLWAGRCMRLQEIDLAPRPWVPDSGWPIRLAEIERYYPRAGEILGLPALSNFEFANNAGVLAPAERTLLARGEFAAAMALWAPKPKRFGDSYRAALTRSPRVRLLLNANVTNIALDDDGRKVQSLTVKTLTGRTFQVVGRVFVLACGGLETPRLLLVSRDRNANGVGNDFDLVGRYFMDHPRTAFGKVRLRPGRPLSLMRGWPQRRGKVQLGVGLTAKIQEREGLLNHYLTVEEEHSGYVEGSYQTGIELGKVLLRRGHAGTRFDIASALKAPEVQNYIYLLSPKEIVPHWLWRWYTIARRAMPQKPAEKRYVVVYFCEQPPDPDSRVTLSTSTDRLGLNRLVLDWRVPGTVERSVLRLQQALADALSQEGLGTLEAGVGAPRYVDASHHMGTTRMSDSPRRGVVDGNGQVYGVHNLYVAGSAVFPSVGYANPTLTIVALTLRLAEHVQRAHP
jgi:choline dehydrogenase-like flavoprotein